MVRVCLSEVEIDCDIVRRAIENEETIWLDEETFIEYEDGKLFYCEPDREDCIDPYSTVCYDITEAVVKCDLGGRRG